MEDEYINPEAGSVEAEVIETEVKKGKKRKVKKPLTKGRKIARAIILSFVGVN